MPRIAGRNRGLNEEYYVAYKMISEMIYFIKGASW